MLSLASAVCWLLHTCSEGQVQTERFVSQAVCCCTVRVGWEWLAVGPTGFIYRVIRNIVLVLQSDGVT
jgi:hypothetical protein